MHYCIYKSNYLTLQVVPSEHANKHLYECQNKGIWLTTGTSKFWYIKLIYTEGEYKLGKGWREFVTDNTIEVDDVTVFKIRSPGFYSVRFYTSI